MGQATTIGDDGKVAFEETLEREEAVLESSLTQQAGQGTILKDVEKTVFAKILEQEGSPPEATEQALAQAQQVTQEYPLHVNKYYQGLIKSKGDGIWTQCMPDLQELELDAGVADPLHEEDDLSGIPGLTHRYPDRALLLVSNVCSMYCRFCTRKRKVGKQYETITDENFEKAIAYLKEHEEIRDVIMSGGDPLMLPVKKLEYFISRVREIAHNFKT